MEKKQKNTFKEEDFTRRVALKKIGRYGKYTALTALGTYILLNPKKAQAASLAPPGSGF